MTIETNVRVWREGKCFIAHALPLDISSAGDTAETARIAVREAIELFLVTARDHGSLQDVLEECGYTLEDGEWVAPQIVSQQQDHIAV